MDWCSPISLYEKQTMGLQEIAHLFEGTKEKYQGITEGRYDGAEVFVRASS